MEKIITDEFNEEFYKQNDLFDNSSNDEESSDEFVKIGEPISLNYDQLMPNNINMIKTVLVLYSGNGTIVSDLKMKVMAKIGTSIEKYAIAPSIYTKEGIKNFFGVDIITLKE